MIILLFSSTHEFLGEFCFEEGACKRSTWTEQGMQLYPGVADAWLTSGIQTTISRESQTTEGPVRSWGHQTTLLRSAGAELAFRKWALDAGNLFIDLPDRFFAYWETLCRLDLSPQERYVILHTMRTSPHHALEIWERVLQDALQAKSAVDT